MEKEDYGELQISVGSHSVELDWSLYVRPRTTFYVITLQSRYPQTFERRRIVNDLSGNVSVKETHGNKGYKHKTNIQISKTKSPWLFWWQEGLISTSGPSSTLFLILPVDSGYLIRRNMVQERVLGWDPAILTFDREDTDAQFSITRADGNAFRLTHLLDNAAGGVLVDCRKASHGVIDGLCALTARLNLPWVLDQRTSGRCVVLVTGGYSLKFRRRLFEAAADLSMQLIVVDKPGHWLESNREQAASVVQDFLPIDMTIDDGLPSRIATAVHNCKHPVDGITTVADSFLHATAKAAEILRLPTSSAQALRLSTDKTLMREKVPIPLKDEGFARDGQNTVAPAMIVKPTHGAGSLGVFLARSIQERQQAEETIRAYGKEPVLEPYVDGPEVDVDIVLSNSQVLIAKVTDNFPTTAEGFPSRFNMKSWVETGSMSPSGLSEDEQSRLRNTIASQLLALGFHSGVFHCEARVLQSTSTYVTGPSGYPRLGLSPWAATSSSAAIALIEVNARAPGTTASEVSRYACGINYYALQLLIACDDVVRLAGLARPFEGPVGWWGTGAVAAEKGGKFSPQAMFTELAVTSPHLMRHVKKWTVFFEEGERIQDPTATGRFQWVAWFLAHSDQSRSHLENILETIRDSLSFDIT